MFTTRKNLSSLALSNINLSYYPIYKPFPTIGNRFNNQKRTQHLRINKTHCV